MNHTKLEQLGLSKEEAKVYLAVLELGDSYVSAIAKRAGVHRVACYHTLDNLNKMGIVSCYTKNKKKHYSVDSPRALVKKHEDRFLKAKELLPELLSISNSLTYKPNIQFFEGLHGIQHIFEDTLGASDEILGYTNLAQLPEVFSDEFLRKYINNLINRRIKSRMLSPITPKGLLHTQTYYPKQFDHNLIEVLFVNSEQFLFEYEIRIYQSKVAIISLNPEEKIGFIIESPIFANTQRGIFNLAWLGATSFVAK